MCKSMLAMADVHMVPFIIFKFSDDTSRANDPTMRYFLSTQSIPQRLTYVVLLFIISIKPAARVMGW